MAPKTKNQPSMAFTAALAGYWLENKNQFSDCTIRDYRLTFTRLATYLDDPPVAAITSDDIRHFLNNHLVDLGLGDKTRSNHWVALSSFWSWAATELRIEHIIRGRVAQPDYTRPLIQEYSQTEIKAMLAACTHNAGYTTSVGVLAKNRRPTAARDRAILLTLLDTGIRASELCDLTIADYNTMQGLLHIRHGKGDKARYAFLAQSGQKALWKYLSTRQQPKPIAPLFATEHNTHLDRKALYRFIHSTGQRAGVQDAYIHKFRHTFAIEFLRNGGNVLELQKLLGHEKMETIRIYADLAQIDLQRAISRASPVDNWHL